MWMGRVLTDHKKRIKHLQGPACLSLWMVTLNNIELYLTFIMIDTRQSPKICVFIYSSASNNQMSRDRMVERRIQFLTKATTQHAQPFLLKFTTDNWWSTYGWCVLSLLSLIVSFFIASSFHVPLRKARNKWLLLQQHQNLPFRDHESE